MSSTHKELYEFDKFRLDVSERILWREDERVPISEKAFDTLRALVRRGNHLVGKDELLNEVWADAIVEENNLDKNISLLRQILGEKAGEGKFIETVRGHGYRFVPCVQVSHSEFQVSSPAESEIEHRQSSNEGESEIEHLKLQRKSENNNQSKIENQKSETGQNQNRKIYALAALILLIAFGAAVYFWQPAAKPVADAPIKSIAVLPFKSLAAENRNEALELGMADSLIAKLGGEEIIVRSLGSVSRYAALKQDSLIAGRELGVETVLDGTIQTADNRVRISARLFRTSDGKQLWTGQFDENFTDIFAVQDAISERAATALKIRLGGREKKASDGKRRSLSALYERTFSSAQSHKIG